jgi:hypothetical protein
MLIVSDGSSKAIITIKATSLFKMLKKGGTIVPPDIKRELNKPKPTT